MRYSYLKLWLKYLNREECWVGMIIGFFATAILLPLPAYFIWTELPFLLDGETVPGTVIGKRQAFVRSVPGPTLAMMPVLAHGGRQGPSYLVHYQYVDLTGQKQTGEDRTSLDNWNELNPGDPVSIRYVRDNPRRSHLESSIGNFWPTIPFVVMGLTIFTGSLALGFRGLQRVNRQVWLVRRGEAVPGRITYSVVEYRGTSKGKSAVTVLEYEFASTDLKSGKLELRGRIQPRWKSGDGVAVLIDPNDPNSHAVDIFDARREDRERLFGIRRGPDG